jgi:hypothetical protein
MLALLNGEGAEPVSARLPEHAVVTHHVSPWLVVVTAPVDAVGTIEATEGVRAVYLDRVPDEVRQTFSAQESVFVEAWEARQAHTESPD